MGRERAVGDSGTSGCDSGGDAELPVATAACPPSSSKTTAYETLFGLSGESGPRFDRPSLPIVSTDSRFGEIENLCLNFFHPLLNLEPLVIDAERRCGVDCSITAATTDAIAGELCRFFVNIVAPDPDRNEEECRLTLNPAFLGQRRRHGQERCRQKSHLRRIH